MQACTRVRLFGVCLACVLIMGGQLSCDRSKPEPEKYDVVLITLDTTRADHLGCYGYYRDTSPKLDEFARESLLFERCIVPMATTLPSHLSMLTGVYPFEHGVLANVRKMEESFQSKAWLRSYAEIARDAGYTTSAFISAVPVTRYTGIDVGFDVFDEPPGRERTAEATNEALFEWLETSGDKPLFMWVHYFDPHNPFEPPAPYDTLFSEDDAQRRYLRERKFTLRVQRPLRPDWWVEAPRDVNLYDGEIRYMDEHVGALLQRLKQRPTWNRTIVVIVGDHGESIGQHGEPAHGHVWDEQVHAPLMMRIPGRKPGRFAPPVSAVDIIPTLLGQAPTLPRGSFLEQVSGGDLLAESAPALPVFSQMSTRDRVDHPVPTYALTSAKWKYMHRDDDNDALYHLERDPFELENVIVENRSVADSFRQKLLAQIAAQRKRGAALQKGPAPRDGKVSPATLAHLESLGYVGDEPDEPDEPDETGDTPTTQATRDDPNDADDRDQP